MLTLATRLSQQPRYSAQLDRSNPLTRALDVAFMRLDQPGLVGATRLTKAGTPTLVPRKHGLGHEFATTSDLFQMAGAPSLPDGSEYTWLVVYQPTATSATGLLVNGDGATRMFQFRHNSATPEFILFNTPTAVAVQVNGAAMTVGKPVNISVRVTTAAVTMFQDGRQTAAGSYSGTARGLTAPNEIQIGNRSGSFCQGSIAMVLRWPRALADAEMAEVTRNPWQVLKAAPRRLWVSEAASGTDTPISPGAGAITVAGYAPTITRTANQSVAPGVGAVAITGYTPTIARTAHQSVAPGAGSLTLTGYAPSIARTAGQSVSPGSGALTIVGYAPSITQGLPAEAPNVYGATVMRATEISSTVTALLDRVAAQAGTMSDAQYSATVMRDTATNNTATMRADDLNQIVELL